MMCFRNFILCAFLLSAFMLPAQLVRKYSNDFLNIGVGGRGLGMSNAQTASVEDVYAAYYNPAGLARIDQTFQLGYMHNEYFAGIAKYDYGSVAVPIQQKKRVIGFSFFRFGIDDIPNTLFLIGPDGTVNYDNIRSFSAADYAFLLSYAQKLPIKGLTVGGNVKIIYRRIGSFAQAYGFGIDAGVQYQYKKWKFGFTGRDISSTFNSWTFGFTEAEKKVLLQTNNTLPSNSEELTLPTFILGAAYEASIKNKFFILPEINFNLTTDGKRNVLVRGKPISMDMNFGLELNYARIGYLRMGIGNIQRVTSDDGKTKTSFSPNLGAGFRIKVIAIDYALTNLNTLGSLSSGVGLYSHVVSLRLDISKRNKPQ